MPDASDCFPNRHHRLSVDATMREHRLRANAVYQDRDHVLVADGTQNYTLYTRDFAGVLVRDAVVLDYGSGPYTVSALSGGDIYHEHDFLDAIKRAISL